MTVRSCAFAVCALAVLLAGPARAETAPVCDVPGYLLIDDNELPHVAEMAKKNGQIDILVVGTGSSTLNQATSGSGAPQGAPGGAYPARLEAALRAKLPAAVAVNVTVEVKPRQSAADMVQVLEKLVLAHKSALVVWQTGTFDAMHGIDPDEFRAALEQGVTKLKAAGADVILMNMQYSPRTESMIAVGQYADNMRLVAREHDIPLFDRLAIMRYWNDTSAFDLYSAAKDTAMAQQVHDCLGRALASLVINAAHLSAHQPKASQ